MSGLNVLMIIFEFHPFGGGTDVVEILDLKV